MNDEWSSDIVGHIFTNKMCGKLPICGDDFVLPQDKEKYGLFKKDVEELPPSIYKKLDMLIQLHRVDDVLRSTIEVDF